MSEQRLPDGWQWFKFGDIVDNFDGRRIPIKLDQRKKGNYPYYGASGVIDYVDEYIFDGEYLLISEDGANLVLRTYPIAFKAIGRFWVNNHAHVVQPKDGVLLEFLLHYFAIVDISPYVAGAAQPKLTQANLNKILIPLPPLDEQQRIAAILAEQMADIEAARRAAEAELEAAEALTAAYLRAVFDSAEARGWETKSITDFAEVSGGIQKQPSRRPSKFSRPYLTVRNVQRGYIDLSNVDEFEVTSDELNRYRLESGDILIVEGNGSLDHIGRSAIFRNEIADCVHQNHVIRVRVEKNKADADYVSLFLNSDNGKAQMVSKARTSSGLYTLSVSKVESLEILLPDVDIQKQLIATLKDKFELIDKARSVISDRIEAIELLPSAVLRQAFSGEL